VVLFQIMHHDEVAFEFDGMVKFMGLELPEELITQPEELRQGYLDAFARFNSKLEEICLSNGCERYEVDTSRPMGELFMDYLNQRAAMNMSRGR